MPMAGADVARRLARLSSDCSFLVSHLIRQNDGRSDTDSRRILDSILDVATSPPHPLLKPSRVSWYGTAAANVFNPVTFAFDGVSEVEAVCFTESTLAGLRAHRDVFNVNYGLAFDRDWLFERGGNPCLNIAERLLRKAVRRSGEGYDRYLYNFIPAGLPPFPLTPS